MDAKQITWTFPVIVGHRWVWVSHACNHGNKYEAVAEYTEQQAAKGVTVQGHDMSQSWFRWN